MFVSLCMFYMQSDTRSPSLTSAVSYQRPNFRAFFFFLFPFPFRQGRETEKPATDRKQLFIRKSLPPSSGSSSCLRHFQELHGHPPVCLPFKLKSPRRIPTVPSSPWGGVEDYCFPICCPEQTRPYQSKPAQLLFHMALMYWKAFHSRLPLAAAAEQVSVARIPQWRTIGLFC